MEFARCMSIVVLVAAPFAAAAQDRAPLPDPLAPAGAASKPAYESALSNYRRMPALPEAGTAWREANDVAGALGGHAGHARQPKAAGSAAAGSLPSPSPSGHDHHGMHHGTKEKS